MKTRNSPMTPELEAAATQDGVEHEKGEGGSGLGLGEGCGEGEGVVGFSEQTQIGQTTL